MLDLGSGPPVVVLPGVQGRWEWMRPGLDALAERCRVLTDSLPGERGSLAGLDPGRGFDQHVAWVDALLDRAGVRRAVVCGVSYGGLVALRYAARRPERTAGLVIVSSPAPGWQPNCRVEWYLARPRLLFPVFALSSPLRLHREIAAAFPNPLRRGRFWLQHLQRITRYPCTPVRMARRVRLLAGTEFAADCRRVHAPALVVTGDPGLDRVVPVESTRAYVDALGGGAAVGRIHGTGHMGLMTKPDRFRDLVGGFAAIHGAAPPAPTPARVAVPA